MDPTLPWLYEHPFVFEWTVQPDAIDHYNHVNNVEYVAKLEQTAWAHSNALGLDITQYKELDRGMAITKHEIEYLAAAKLNDKILCATWIASCDKRLSLARHFQFIRPVDGKTLLKATTHFACIALSTGKPKRMPALFTDVYGAQAEKFSHNV